MDEPHPAAAPQPLLHRAELDKLMHKTRETGHTIVPLSLYFKDGRAKVEIALAKGKKPARQAACVAGAAGPPRGGPGDERPLPGGCPVKRLGSIVALVFGLAALLIVPAAAGVTGSAGGLAVAEAAWAVPMADQARSFDVTFEVAPDGSVKVTERISWEFPSGQARRGIERLVTTRAGYRESEDVYRLYRISEVTASSPSGAPDDVNVTDLGATTRIRVGNPNQTVSGAGLRRRYHSTRSSTTSVTAPPSSTTTSSRPRTPIPTRISAR